MSKSLSNSDHRVVWEYKFSSATIRLGNFTNESLKDALITQSIISKKSVIPLTQQNLKSNKVTFILTLAKMLK